MGADDQVTEIIICGDDESIQQIALILTKFCLGLSPMVDGVTTYDILTLMLKEGLTADTATDWGMMIAGTIHGIKSKDKH